MESIVKFFSRYYNFVKTFKKYYKNSEKVEIFDKIFEKYKDQIQTFLKKYNLEERFIQAIDNDAPADIIFIFVELIINALRDNDLRKFLLEMWITSVQHFEELIPNIVIPILDPDVYYEIKSLIEEAASVDAESVIRVLWSYFRIISEKPTTLDINSSLLVNKEKKWKNIEIVRSLGIDKSVDKIITVDKLIEEAGEQEFKIYFFDWTLKFGYLIEAHIKNILLFILNLYYIKKGVPFESDYNDDCSIGEVLYAFKKENINLNRILKHYRNAIFHSNFFLNYDLDMEKREICIRVFIYSESEKRKVPKIYKSKISEFMSYFHRMIMLSNTFDIILATVFAKDFLVEKIENAFNDIDKILDKIPKLSAEEMKKLFDEYRNKTLN